jgi:hypothetical protein
LCAASSSYRFAFPDERRIQSARFFLSPADGTERIARAKTMKVSGSIGVVTVEVFSNKESAETLCAFGTATMRAMDLPGGLRQP